MPTVPLRRLVDDHQWEAEDLAGRLGIVAHAAFLRAGFVPYGDGPSSGHILKQMDEIGPSATSLSRRYTAAQIARRRGADVAVQELCVWGNGDVAFQAYLLTRDGNRRCLYEAALDEATLAPILCCRLPDAARALEAGSAGSWLWKSLADWVFPGLFLELCRRNNLPVTGFASLPEDSKVEILKRLADGKDLARVECTSKQLWRLVTERDGELWKAMYASLVLLPDVQSSDSEGLGSWKERYMNARRRRRLRWPCLFYSYDGEWLAQLARPQEPSLPLLFGCQFPLPRRRVDHFTVARCAYGIDLLSFSARNGSGSAAAGLPELQVTARVKNASRKHPKVPRNDYQKKRHGAGAIHSPSARYGWKHR